MLPIQKLFSCAGRHSVAQRAVQCRVRLHFSYALGQRGDKCLTSRAADCSAPRVRICKTARMRPSSAFGAAAWPCAPTTNTTSACQARASWEPCQWESDVAPGRWLRGRGGCVDGCAAA